MRLGCLKADDEVEFIHIARPSHALTLAPWKAIVRAPGPEAPVFHKPWWSTRGFRREHRASDDCDQPEKARCRPGRDQLLNMRRRRRPGLLLARLA